MFCEYDPCRCLEGNARRRCRYGREQCNTYNSKKNLFPMHLKSFIEQSLKYNSFCSATIVSTLVYFKHGYTGSLRKRIVKMYS